MTPIKDFSAGSRTSMKVQLHRRMTYYNIICFVEPCFGICLDGCICYKSVHYNNSPMPVFCKFRFTALVSLRDF